MRYLVTILCGLVLLLGAAAAVARLEPPLEVHLIGTPRAAEPGVPFRGQLRFDAGQPLVLEDLRFEEGKWDQVALAAPPELSLTKGASGSPTFTSGTIAGSSLSSQVSKHDKSPQARPRSTTPACLSLLENSTARPSGAAVQASSPSQLPQVVVRSHKVPWWPMARRATSPQGGARAGSTVTPKASLSPTWPTRPQSS